MILVTGASGHVGGQVAALLVARGIPVRVLIRPGARYTPPPGAEVAVGDYGDLATFGAACAGIATAIVISASAPPGERAELHAQAFVTAKAARVGHIVYLSLLGSSPRSRYRYARDHYASECALELTGVPATVVRNGKYTEQLLEPELAGTDGIIRGPVGAGRIAWISRADTARVLAAIAVDPPGGMIAPTGPESLTLTETAARLARALGRDIHCENEPGYVARARALGWGIPSWRADNVAGTFAAIAADDYAPVCDAARWIGRSESLEDTIASGALDALRSATPRAPGRGPTEMTR